MRSRLGAILEKGLVSFQRASGSFPPFEELKNTRSSSIGVQPATTRQTRPASPSLSMPPMPPADDGPIPEAGVPAAAPAAVAAASDCAPGEKEPSASAASAPPADPGAPARDEDSAAAAAAALPLQLNARPTWGTRPCSACKRTRDSEGFSVKQWSKPAATRRCRRCIEDAQHPTQGKRPQGWRESSLEMLSGTAAAAADYQLPGLLPVAVAPVAVAAGTIRGRRGIEYRIVPVAGEPRAGSVPPPAAGSGCRTQVVAASTPQDWRGDRFLEGARRQNRLPTGAWVPRVRPLGLPARPSPIPSLCTRPTRAGIEWCGCHRAVLYGAVTLRPPTTRAGPWPDFALRLE